MSKALREATNEFVRDYENGDLGDLKHYARALRAALAEDTRDWSLLEATQESLREHMAEVQRLRAALAQPATIAEWWATKQAASGVPLTDEQINQITAEQWGAGLGAPYAAYRAYARAIEAAHGITPAKEAP